MRQSSHQGFSNLVGPPRVSRNTQYSSTATVWCEIWDSAAGSAAKSMVGRSLAVGPKPCPIAAANPRVGTSLCTRCWRWGHPHVVCRSNFQACPICSEPHDCDLHWEMAGCCKPKPKAKGGPIAGTPDDQPCPHTPRCRNCGGAHSADAKVCPFWCHRFDNEWIKKRYQEVRDGVPPRPRNRANPPVPQNDE